MNRKEDQIKIMEVKEPSAAVLSSLQYLLPQLTVNYKSFERKDLDEILNSTATRLMVAVDQVLNDKIVGTYSIVIFRIPTGSIARIEDVVVDEDWRGMKIGRKLVQHAIEYAKEFGVRKIELTSHQSRIEANKLYKSLGFKHIETNVYRLNI